MSAQNSGKGRTDDLCYLHSRIARHTENPSMRQTWPNRPNRTRRRPRLEPLEDRSVPSSSTLIAVGADAGGGPHVRLLDGATGAEVRSFFAYDAAFRGGVRVALADFTDDGVPDVVTAAGPGGGPHVKIFDGRTGQLLSQFFAFDAAFTGGVTVAAGDVTGDGRPDVVVGADAGGGPQVKVFAPDGTLKASFVAYDSALRGGVHVAVADVNGDGKGDVVTGAGRRGGPH